MEFPPEGLTNPAETSTIGFVTRAIIISSAILIIIDPQRPQEV